MFEGKQYLMKRLKMMSMRFFAIDIDFDTELVRDAEVIVCYEQMSKELFFRQLLAIPLAGCFSVLCCRILGDCPIGGPFSRWK
jgi:hypothetical protein